MSGADAAHLHVAGGGGARARGEAAAAAATAAATTCAASARRRLLARVLGGSRRGARASCTATGGHGRGRSDDEVLKDGALGSDASSGSGSSGGG